MAVAGGAVAEMVVIRFPAGGLMERLSDNPATCSIFRSAISRRSTRDIAA
jgi:hypothetical protein